VQASHRFGTELLPGSGSYVGYVPFADVIGTVMNRKRVIAPLGGFVSGRGFMFWWAALLIRDGLDPAGWCGGGGRGA
jgi:hypothetical protein